jgi:DNA polymerase II
VSELQGWLLDVHEDRQGGAAAWFLDEDGARRRLHQDFPVTFYAAGPTPQLRELSLFLKQQPHPVHLERQERQDLFCTQPVTVLSIRVEQAARQPALFKTISQRFPTLTYYDADLPLPLRFAAATGAFPLAHCRASTAPDGRLLEIAPLDSPWDLDPEPPPLRSLRLETDTNPFHAPPRHLLVHAPRHTYRLSLAAERPLLVNLRALLRRHDPDLLLTNWGDTWILPRLLEMSRRWHIHLPFNREKGRAPAYRPERSYFSYGQVVHIGQQYHFFGRWHVDCCNAVLFADYEMDGVFEMARVTALPVQTAARVSPGSGISAMQVLTALRQGVLVPWHKQQAERPKTAMDMLRADQGGLVYQPLVGLHRDVAEVDFISMYPSIMVHFNISPETVGAHTPDSQYVPQLGLVIDQGRPGLVPQTLDPLLSKRISLKHGLAQMPRWDPRRRAYKARASAHKWLLVTCFGYLGYKNARFGRIEAHEAVTAYGREALLLAKEAAEDLGGTVLHLYVDGMWVQQPGASTPTDFQPLLDEIAARTGLPIALDGVYRWVAFLPSRQNASRPVANRYFGVFQDGSLKMRGIEARRGDTCPYIAQAQVELLEHMAKAGDADQLPAALPDLIALLRRQLARLRQGRVPLEELVVRQKLSRRLEEYRTLSPAARAAAQLLATGRTTSPGERVRFIHTLGEPGVHAWDLPLPLDPAKVDLRRYRTLLLRAAAAVLQPLGLDEAAVESWAADNLLPMPQLALLTVGSCQLRVAS